MSSNLLIPIAMSQSKSLPCSFRNQITLGLMFVEMLRSCECSTRLLKYIHLPLTWAIRALVTSVLLASFHLTTCLSTAPTRCQERLDLFDTWHQVSLSGTICTYQYRTDFVSCKWQRLPLKDPTMRRLMSTHWLSCRGRFSTCPRPSKGTPLPCTMI